MRDPGAAVLQALVAPNYGVHWLVLVEDPDGNMAEVTLLEGLDFFAGFGLNLDIDQLSDTLALRLRRDYGVPVRQLSLAPLREDSVLNRDSEDEYAPRIDVDRRVEVYCAIMGSGLLPGEYTSGSTDWHLIFEGFLDAWDSARQPMELPARDQMGELIDREIETVRDYGSEAGVATEDLVQQFIDDNFGMYGPELFVPASPGTSITRWRPATNVGEEAASLVEGTGWTLRYRWDEDTRSYRLTLFFIDPEDLTPVYTFGAGTYLRITQLTVDRRDVVNRLIGTYTDRTTGNPSPRMIVQDGDSIVRYGLRARGVNETADSPIDSEEELAALLDAILAALKDPIASVEIETLFMPFLEPGDVIGIAADGVNINTDLVVATKSIRHDVGPGRERTFIQGRAAPAAAYLRWKARVTGETGGGGTEPADPNQATIESLAIQEVNTAEGQFTQTAVVLGQHTARWVLYERDGAWPTENGLEDGVLDRRYIVGDFSASDPQPGRRSAQPSVTRFAIGIAKNSAEKIGDRESASVAVGAGGIGSEGPALEFVGVEPEVDRVRTFWAPNGTILADLGRYVVDVFRDSLIIALAVPAEDEEADDTDAVPCGGDDDCQYFQFTWRFRLRDTSLVHPTVEYSAPYGQLWEAFTL